jgi:hypothetical protein
MVGRETRGSNVSPVSNSQVNPVRQYIYIVNCLYDSDSKLGGDMSDTFVNLCWLRWL